MRLWEAEHPYYGPEGSQIYGFESWAEFLEEFDELDLDLNLVVRWDWTDRDYWSDDESGGDLLLVYFLLPRKSQLFSCEVAVSSDDEPAIREWLAVRWRYLVELWEPLSAEGADDG
jgi:hypothetical protein